MEIINALYPLLRSPKKIVITTHQKPDGDAMGSSLGLYHFLVKMNHDVTVVSPTNWADFLSWLPGVEAVIDFEAKQNTAIEKLNQADIIFCLDFNIFYRTKNVEKYLAASNAVKVLIDHHEQPQVSAFQYGISDINKSSTCEMVYDFIIQSENPELLDLNIATCLYTGTMTDTGSFRFPATSASVHRMVAHFKDMGLQHTPIHEQVYDSFLENRLRFIGHALLNRMDVLYEYNTAVMAISRDDIIKYDIKTGDTEGLVNYLLTIKGIKFGAIVIDRNEERKWSFRSKGDFDVNEFARNHFEGGGHKNAAGGRSSQHLEKTLAHFYEVLPKYKNELE
ncbi:DHH family phosphoesterase [Hydrotalea sandarakina]|jgi:phosphoesterase RecJ-like protein|uniref:Phosphoesterase RecJ-like protein n=1 Tax=Hydrotalea sandarakina TaxID=1004304 RepID=A0A2W7RZ92_9BACT|nr:DHH family phosphoesterase [Hydrotalea sandarakina]PZX65594.1 phosphoesterase RecJ-like protein [Hydrotalea sandarakina]